MRHSLARTLLAALVALVCFGASHGSAIAQTADPKASPTAQDVEQAKNHMAAGVAFMQDPDGARYEEAYPEFRKAYELSGSLNALHNLAISAQKLELDGEAISYYETVLEKKGDDLDENDKAQITRDLAGLKAAVAWVSLSSDRGEVTVVDERTPRSGSRIRNKYKIGIQQKKFGLHPGQHTFTATTEGYPEQVWTVQISNGGSLNHEFVFDKNAPVTADGFTADDMGTTPDPEPDTGDDGGGLPAYVWIAGGVTIAAAIPMAIFMGMSASQKSEYDNDILGKKPKDEQQEAADSLKTTNLLADVFLGVTAAGAVATVILVIVAMSGDESEASADAGPRFGVDYTVSPLIDRDGVGAVVTTTF
jgi:heme exporter protein D